MANQPVPTPEQTPVQVPHRKARFPWVGIVLIILGIVFFLQQTGNLTQHFNWWALFILIPAISSLTGMYYAIRSSGTFNQTARSALGTSVVIFTLAFMFLFNLDWAIYWPLMVIAAGFSILIGSIPGDRLKDRENIKRFMSLGSWFGAGAILLGTAFLLKNLTNIDVAVLLGNRWYAWLVLLPGIGNLVNAFLLYRAEGNKVTMGVRVLIGLGLIIIILAVLMLIGVAWNVLGPLMIIGVGLAFIISAFLK
jgi:hypothetical protein